MAATRLRSVRSLVQAPVMHEVRTDAAPAPVGPYSQAIKANGFLFTTGQIPIVPETGELHTGTFSEQCRVVLENVKAILEAGGSTLEHVVKVTIFFKDMEKFGELKPIYNEYFEAAKPARSFIQAVRLPKDADVEIEAIALCDS